MDDDFAWMETARHVAGAGCDALFGWHPDFYYGPRDAASRETIDALRQPLPASPLPLLDGEGLTTAALTGHADVLIAHYARLFALASRHGRLDALDEPFPYFRVKPVIFEGAVTLTAFAWLDTVDETRAVLRGLGAMAASASPAEVYSNTDQGWDITLVTRGDRLFMREWNWEEPEEDDGRGILSFNLAEVAWQAREALARLDALHGALTRRFGRDYWAAPGRSKP